MLSLILVVFLGIVALGMLGVAIFEAVGHARGAPSPRLNFMRPLVGPLSIAILAAWAAWRTYKRRQLACGKRTS